MTFSPSPFQPQLWQWRSQTIPYVVQGQGQPLVLVHGFGARWAHWRHNIGALAAAGYQVFALDLLGFGAASKPPWDYSLELWQSQLEAFCEEKVQRPAVFCGNSIGALLSLIMAVQKPQWSAGAVLINCAGGLNHRPEELPWVLGKVMATFTRLVTSPVTGPFIFNRVRQPHRIKNTLYQVYGDRRAVTDELVAMLHGPSSDPGAYEVFASILGAPAGPTPASLLANLEKPLLVLWGEYDPWTPIAGAKIYQDLAAHSELARFHTIPRAGHCPHDENPNLVNHYIEEWLGDYGDRLWCGSEALRVSAA